MSTPTQRDIVFGHARIGYNNGQGPVRVVALKLDAYMPAVAARAPVPGLVLAHGGVLPRGSKGRDTFSPGNGTSPTAAQYFPPLSALGLPSFSVPYPLPPNGPQAQPP